MTRSILNPTTSVRYASAPKAARRWSSWWRRMLRPSANGVSGFGYGRPSRVPMPAARITTLSEGRITLYVPVNGPIGYGLRSPPMGGLADTARSLLLALAAFLLAGAFFEFARSGEYCSKGGDTE